MTVGKIFPKRVDMSRAWCRLVSMNTFEQNEIAAVNETTLKRAYRKADRAQSMLHRPNVSDSTRAKAHEMLREARNLTARAYGMPEQF